MLKNIPPSVYFSLLIFLAASAWMIHREGWVFYIVFAIMATAVLSAIHFISEFLDRKFDNRRL